MQRFLDSSIASFLRLLGDLMVLNFLCIILCLPIITMGASLTATYSVLIRIVRKETVPVVRTFFKSFKNDFLKALGFELIFLVLGFIAFIDINFAFNFEGTYKSLFLVVGTIVAVIALIIWTMTLTQLPVYDNTFKNYLKNSFLLAACAPGWLILSWIIWMIPIAAILLFTDYAIKFGFIFLMFGVSGPALGTAYCINRIFTKVENAQQQ